jgi:cytidylate kinase
MDSRQHKPVIIAIDGFSSCGKSTLSKQLAEVFNLIYIDTGAMYRAVTLYFIEQDINLNSDQQIADSLDKIQISFENLNGHNTTFLNGRNVEAAIRSMDVSAKVSQVAALSAVRKRMVALQQQMGKPKENTHEQFNGLVMDGRDIGTVVFPDADIKFFITADPKVRAKRRHQEILAKGGTTSYEEILDNVNLRDAIDTGREDSPLRMAEDAILIDNTHLSISEQLETAMNVIAKYLADQHAN